MNIRFFKGVKKNYALIKEAYGIGSKISIIFYFFQYPFLKVIKRLKKNHVFRLIHNVTLKNKDGIFFCGKDLTYLNVGVSTYEDNLDKYFNIKKGIFIDIGSHIGRYSIKMGRIIKGKVISIEPNKRNFHYLQKNIRLNNLDNIIPLKLICADKNKVMKLNLRGRASSLGHSIKANYGEGYEEVEAKKLDTILKEQKIKRVDLIKIDVEGAELEVLRGAKDTLKKNYPKIIFESGDENLNLVKKLLNSYNYKIKRLDEQNFLAVKKD